MESKWIEKDSILLVVKLSLNKLVDDMNEDHKGGVSDAISARNEVCIF